MTRLLSLSCLVIATALAVGGCATSAKRNESISVASDPRPQDSHSGTETSIQPVAFHLPSSDQQQKLADAPADDFLSEPIAFAKLISEQRPDSDLDLNNTGLPAEALDSMDLESLESLAVSSHPEIQQAQSLVNQARGKALQAGLPYNPVLQYQTDEAGNVGISGLHSVMLSQQFVTANKLGLARQEQLQLVQQRMAMYEFSRLKVLTGVRAAYAEMLIAQDRTVITKSIAELAQRSADTVQALLDAEEVSRIAFLQARVEAQRAKLMSQNAVATLQQKRRALAAAVGVASLPAETIRGEAPAALDPQPWQSLVDELSSLSPQMSSAGASLQRARWALQLACAQVTPNVTAQLGVGYDDGTDDTFALIGLSVPLPIRNRNQGNIRAAQASISAASANLGRTELALQQALANAVGRYEVARQTYQQLREEISPDAKEAFDLAQRAFESGEADYLEVLTAQRTWFDTRLAAINALQTAKTADAEIRGSLTVSVP